MKLFEIIQILHLEYSYKKGEHVPGFLKGNIIAIGEGFKEVDGKMTDEKCIKFAVRKKKNKKDLKKGKDIIVDDDELIPDKILGYKTDVVVRDYPKKIRDDNLGERVRPAKGAMWASRYLPKYTVNGTKTCKMYYRGSVPVTLSNRHVYRGDSDEAYPDEDIMIEIHDDIIQSGGIHHTEDPDDYRFATLIDYSENVDSAIGVVYEDGGYYTTGPSYLSEDMGEAVNGGFQINRALSPHSPSTLQVGDKVKKLGLMTGYVEGTVNLKWINDFEIISDPEGQAIAVPGDSGSMVVDENNRPTGQLFAQMFGDEYGVCHYFEEGTYAYGVNNELNLSFNQDDPKTPPRIGTLNPETSEGEIKMKGIVRDMGDATDGEVLFRWRKQGQVFEWKETPKQTITGSTPFNFEHTITENDGVYENETIEYMAVVEWEINGVNYLRRYPSEHEENRLLSATMEATPEVSVTTHTATGIEQTSATMVGEVTELDIQNCQTVFFWREDGGSWTMTEASPAEMGHFYHSLTGLTKNTSYSYFTAIMDSEEEVLDVGTTTTFTTLDEEPEPEPDPEPEEGNVKFFDGTEWTSTVKVFVNGSWQQKTAKYINGQIKLE